MRADTLRSILVAVIGLNKPSTRLRMLPLVEHLRVRGHRVELIEIPRSLGGRLRLLRRAASADIVVLQKKLFPPFYVGLLRRANPALIFDVDDAVMFHEIERGEPLAGEFFRRFCAIAAASRHVVTGNGYLAEFARAARAGADAGGVAVLPTPVDMRAVPCKPTHGDADDGRIVVGWIGTKGNLRQLSPLADVLRAATAAVPGLCLHLVADAGLELPGVAVEHRPWRAETETSELHGFDIGLMPLEDNLWNRGKGGYKLLQYMTAGLPAVASPVGINRDIVRDGENGFLAASVADWRDRLIALARDTALRRRIGLAARATVAARYSLDDYLARYVALIEEAEK